MKHCRNSSIRVIPAYVPNSVYAMGMDMSDRLCEKDDSDDPMIMDLIKWNIDHEDGTDESYEWRKMLSYDMLKIVGKMDREWCDSLQRLFNYIGENCVIVRR